MTTITAVKKDGLLAIAADSMTTYGTRKESAEYVASHEKIFRVRDSYLAIAGPAVSKLIVQHQFAKLRDRVRLDSLEHIFATFVLLHEAMKEDYFIRPEEDEDDAFESSRMDTLIVNEHGIFGVDAHRSVEEFTRFYSYGYGQDYAMGAMWAVYEDPGKDAEAVARIGVEAAAEFDNSTGPPIHSCTVRQKARRTRTKR